MTCPDTWLQFADKHFTGLCLVAILIAGALSQWRLK